MAIDPKTGLRDARLRRWRLLAAGLVALAGLPAEGAIRLKRQEPGGLAAPDTMAAAPELCETGGDRVWVAHEGAGACIAYYPSRAFRGVRNAVFFFEGDIPDGLRRDEQKLNDHLARLRQVLERLSQAYKVPYVLVARPGTFGSTGSHRERRGVREYHILNAALDRIRERHQIAEVSLTGQSGGATVAAALLTLGRSDVVCATPASGGYDLPGLIEWHDEKSGREAAARINPDVFDRHYNVMDHIDGIRRSAKRRLFVVGDPGDQVTPFVLQQKFAERVRAAGHHAVTIVGKGSGADRHGLALLGLQLAGLCAAGRSDAEIASAARN